MRCVYFLLFTAIMCVCSTLAARGSDAGAVTRAKGIRAADTLGFEVADTGKAAALAWAQKAAQASAARLQKAEASKDFKTFMDNLLIGAEAVFKRHVAEAVGKGNVGGGVDMSLSVRRLSMAEVRRQIYAMMLPFFLRQVQLVRAEVATTFNQEAGEDLEYTTDLMVDLELIKSATLRSFNAACKALQPADSPQDTWNFDFERYQLQQSLDEYLENRRQQAMLLGVLSRGRKPIDVGMHVLLSHPLGRDYRADPLTENGDRLVYDSALASANDPSVSASAARKVLKPRAASTKGGLMALLGSNSVKANAEFAREMLMFPLSIKNPAVPLATGRQRKQSSVEAAKAFNAEDDGVDRLLRWDVGHMGSAKRALDKAIRSSAAVAPAPTAGDRAANILPMLRDGYYQEPPVHYDHPVSHDEEK